MDKVFYTTAAKNYDWGCTQEINAKAGKHKQGGKVWRKVLVEEGWARDQSARYESGNHGVFEEADFQKLVKGGIIIPVD